MLPPEVAYKKVGDALRDLYGKEQVMARRLIEGLLKGLNSIAEDLCNDEAIAKNA